MKTPEFTNNEPDRVLVLLKEIEKLRKKHDKYYEKIHKEITIRVEELNRICTHKETIIENEIISGDYYNKREYHKITKCKFCKKELGKEITYGSFE